MWPHRAVGVSAAKSISVGFLYQSQLLGADSACEV